MDNLNKKNPHFIMVYDIDKRTVATSWRANTWYNNYLMLNSKL